MENTYQNKKSYKKKSYKNVNKKNAGVVALKEVNKLKKELKQDIEVKFIQTSITNKVPYGANGVELTFNYPEQGITDITRIGNDISLLGFQIRMGMETPALSNTVLGNLAPCTMRIIVGKVRLGYVESATELIDRTLLSDSIYAGRNPAYTHQIKIYYDNVHVLQRQSLACNFDSNTYVSGISRNFIEIYKNFDKPVKVPFSGTTATDDTDNRLFILFISPDVSGYQARADGLIKVRYTDQ